ncbi:hypothetical protein KC349_g86 [Hortaea werneckii]|nr:hypothetical protein KC349_g86 [Hortaea werneckii]
MAVFTGRGRLLSDARACRPLCRWLLLFISSENLRLWPYKEGERLTLLSLEHSKRALSARRYAVYRAPCRIRAYPNRSSVDFDWCTAHLAAP